MTVELIPVIEIGYNNQDVPTPGKYPYWDYAELWDKYNSDSYRTSDRILPLKFVKCNLTIKNGGHLMTLNKSDELNNILRQQI
ncbi:hypothetical protein [Pedobacter sp.]|uniref:hypothetical protein n=1 Tax=Pedobacter sp. TaxID=1411316 RepID=UPI003C6AC140